MGDAFRRITCSTSLQSRHRRSVCITIVGEGETGSLSKIGKVSGGESNRIVGHSRGVEQLRDNTIKFQRPVPGSIESYSVIVYRYISASRRRVYQNPVTQAVDDSILNVYIISAYQDVFPE